MKKRKRPVTFAMTKLFNLYLEFNSKQQDSVQSMAQWRRPQFGVEPLALVFMQLVTSTLTKDQFETFRTMIIHGSELESVEQRQKRIRRQNRLRKVAALHSS